jgi:hypothetical protein
MLTACPMLQVPEADIEAVKKLPALDKIPSRASSDLMVTFSHAMNPEA